MKVKVKFIVARLNGEIIFIEAINDTYTEVQVIIRKDKLDEISIKALQEVNHIMEFKDSFNLGTYEAQDSCGIYGNLKIAIENKEINY